MKICIVSGSHRQNSQSTKVANFIKKTLDDGICEESFIFNLAGNPLPLWDESVWEGDAAWEKLLTPLREQLQSSDAFVIIAPEWHGQVPAGLKNFFLLFGKNELGHKPAMIVTVSSSDGGAYALAELRMSSYKNSRLCYIPEQIIVRNVESVLNEDSALNKESADSYFRERITWTLKILKEYAVALKQVRDTGLTNHKAFGSGM